MQMQANLCRSHGGGGGALSLPEDIIFDVLVRLPANALCRFRCVCKAWRALISDPAFIAAQRSRAGPLIAAVFRSTAERHELRLLDMDGNVLRVFDVVGGTPSLAATRLDRIFVDMAELGAMIIDPASGQNYNVVSSNPPHTPWWASMTSSTTMSEYCFGRAAASGDYKVFRLRAAWSVWHGHSHWCQVATILDDAGGAEPTWRQRPSGPFSDNSFSCDDKATANGLLYFLPCKPYPTSHTRDRIVAFDLESEEWKPAMIKCPCLERKDASRAALTEVKGTLCVVENTQHFGSLSGHYYVNIWLLMDPNKSTWVKEYRIHMPGIVLMYRKPLDVLGDGTMLLLLNVSPWKTSNDNGYFLQLYNSSTEELIDLMEMAQGFNGTMTLYSGSLLP